MENSLFSKYAPILGRFTEAQLIAEIENPQVLLLDSDRLQGRKIEVAYAPFDYVNPNAKIVFVGITPGRLQMRNALLQARRSLIAGRSEEVAMKDAKIFASFSGPMRTNLIAMLDSIKVNGLLGLSTTATLWKEDSEKVHFTSVLRYPVFVGGENYSANPSMVSTPVLRNQMLKWFATEMLLLQDAIFVPLGPKVAEAVETVATHLRIDRGRILSGLPHPSGANAERIAFFLGRKSRDMLSVKVDPVRLIAARLSLEKKTSEMCS